MSRYSTSEIESFINDYLKNDLKDLERFINIYNEEIMEFVQLKNTIQTLRENLPDGYKTQMDIGGNIFMEAKVDNLETILVNVGKDHFIEFTLDEALRFADFKIKLLTKECDALREESIRKRSDIKLALMCVAEKEKWHLEREYFKTFGLLKSCKIVILSLLSKQMEKFESSTQKS